MKELPLGPLFVDIGGCELQPDEKERLTHPLIGGVILFTRNYEHPQQLKTLIESIKCLRTPALLATVDQEGGRVQRFKNALTMLPPASTYGLIYDRDEGAGLEAARCAGYLIAAELREMGVDLSFTPVLDVGTVGSTVIGDRAVHSDPLAVAEIARAHINGLNQGGMGAVGKHFPGHGAVSQDSHTCLPCDNRTLPEIDRCDLVPYRRLRDVLRGVMTAHVSFPHVDGCLPTYSKYWLHDVLRQDIGFSGAIFSDDLSMDGAKIVGGPKERVAKALAAGCDMVLICNDSDAVDIVLDQTAWEPPPRTPTKVLALAGGAVDPSHRRHAREVLASLTSGSV